MYTDIGVDRDIHVHVQVHIYIHVCADVDVDMATNHLYELKQILT